ncbi:hypothetical protein HOE425_330664 [Hoeflea sp. EC-HK425]|nr:hypothetical protein HOE425_330664 [Hoeflea sp. EC-HK425]
MSFSNNLKPNNSNASARSAARLTALDMSKTAERVRSHEKPRARDLMSCTFVIITNLAVHNERLLNIMARSRSLS